MRTFQPLNPADPVQARILQAALRADQLVALTYITVAPEKPQDGLYLAAAGVLGVSRGLYRYDANGAAYTFIA